VCAATWLLSALCLLSGCGRVGVRLLALDAGVGPSDVDADTPLTMCPLICGCGGDDTLDSDGDSTPDCIDFCPGEPDRDGLTCNCAAAAADADGDGSPNCMDLCPRDPAKIAPTRCGCGVEDLDRDADGTPDCSDECPDDPGKARRGACGCGVRESDTDLDGTPDCIDQCDGIDDDVYVADMSCGVGYCRIYNRASTCVAGVELACRAAEPLRETDDTCDGVDDDCDGAIDEDYAATASRCGVGACMRTGTIRCVDAELVDSCEPGTALAADDATCDAVDEDCDGATDEDTAVSMHDCPPGSCALTGSIACVGGEFVDSCGATEPDAPADTTCNHIDDDCDGFVDEDVAFSMQTCGVGACERTGMISCVNGRVVDSCSAAEPASANDNTCDGIDDDCDGRVDENYRVVPTSCGQGVCAASGFATCGPGGVMRDSCVPGTPTSASDDLFVPGNGVDDDCDGTVDEQVPACDTSPKVFEAGTYPDVAIPGNCKHVSVRLWGGGGASGQSILLALGGVGGPGGYAEATLLVQRPLSLHIGGAAANGCNAGGTNAGSASFDGGSGGDDVGADGADGMVEGGGREGAPADGDHGGRGFFGGGGGGHGEGGLGASGNAGGGGAASVVMMNGVRAVTAGGGGGGGGAQAVSLLGSFSFPGGAGGSGCSGDGQVASPLSGGGGGGGVCQGASVRAGISALPAFSDALPSGRARGGIGSCAAGGPGYAILVFAP